MKSKMVAIFAALMVTLMVAGFAYAHWSKVVTISGTVSTGTFELEPSFKVTYPWEVPECEEMPLDDKKVAWMHWWIEDNTLYIWINNTYPCLTIGVTFDIENTGSVPAGLYKWTVTVDGTSYTIFDAEDIPGSIINPKMTEDEVEAALEKFVKGIAAGAVTVTVDFAGSNFWQIDPGEKPTVDITIHFEEELPEDKTYTFTVKLEYWNWNEVGYL